MYFTGRALVLGRGTGARRRPAQSYLSSSAGMFQKAFSLYDSDVVKRRVRTSFTAIKNRTLQRFGYDLEIDEEPFGTYYAAILHLIEVANAVKGSALHMQTSMAESKKASSLLREALASVAAQDEKFSFNVDTHADAVTASWDTSLEHALDELLRTLEARLSQFTEIRKRLQDREVRRAEYTMEAQNLENMHLRNMPVEATSKVEQKVAEMSRGISQLNGSIVMEMSDLYKERFQIMAQFLQELEKCQRRFHGAAASALEGAVADADSAAIVTEDAPASDEARAGSDPGAEAGSGSATGTGYSAAMAADAGSAGPSTTPDAGAWEGGDEGAADPSTGGEDAAEVTVTMDEDANVEGQRDRMAVL